jgi:excisionase family DNA binding protein
MPDSDERPVDLAGIAEYLGIAKYTASTYAKNGDIPGFKLGGRWRFYISEVRAHLTKPLPDPWMRSPHPPGVRPWLSEGDPQAGRCP